MFITASRTSKNDDSSLRHEVLRIHEVLTAHGQSERVCDVESLNERNGLLSNVCDVKVETVDTITQLSYQNKFIGINLKLFKQK